MTASSFRLYTLIAASAFALAVALPALAVDSPSPMADKPKAETPRRRPTPRPPRKRRRRRREKKSEQQFIDGYKAAHAMIYKRHDYTAGIDKLKSLGHDDNADVANLIGYSSRKLGRYDDSKLWYERALAADPDPRPHLVVLRHVARRAGQSAQGARLSRQGGIAVRHQVPRIHRAQGRDRRHPHVLIAASSATQTPGGACCRAFAIWRRVGLRQQPGRDSSSRRSPAASPGSPACRRSAVP